MKSLLASVALLAIRSMIASPPSAALGLSLPKIQNNKHATAGMRRVVVTDGSLGREICESLLMNYQDVRVVLAGKDKDALGPILDKVGDEYWRNLEHIYLDIDCDASVDMAAHELALHVDPLHAIIYTHPNDSVAMSPPTDVDNIRRPKHRHYMRLKRASKALMPLLQPTDGRWVTVVSKEGQRFCENLAGNPEQARLFKALLEPERVLLATAENQQEPWEAAVNQLDHISQTYALTDSGYGLSEALVKAYSVMLAQQQDRHGVLVHSVEQSCPDRIIRACMESPDDAHLSPFPLPSLSITQWVKHLWAMPMSR